MSSLLQIRDEAFSESAQAHERIRFELAVFRNEGYRDGDRVGTLTTQVNESLMPQISTGCIRLIPAFREQISEIHLESDKPMPTVHEQMLIEGISNWDKMYEEVDDEGGRMRSAIYRNLTTGNEVSKIKYDTDRKLVRAESINPTSFAPDPMCSQSNFSDAMFVCQKSWQNRRYMKKHYPDWTPPRKTYSASSGAGTPLNQGSHPRHKIDEIWMRREVAEDVGIDISGTKRRIIVAKLIDDKLYKAQGSPYWYPDFPFAHWRNFLDLQSDGQPHSFWGYGYGTLCWTQQKMLDEFLANFILILRNLGVGRFIAKDGAVDEEQIDSQHGKVIKINENFQMTDFEHLPPEEVPLAIPQFIQHITEIMTEMMPSLSQVFAGDAPNNSSGRAIASLQFANFNQLSDNIREMNEFRLRRKRIRLALVQQFARKPQEPHLWRGGLDMQIPFPEDARHIGYRTKMPDLSSLPNTPAGRLQVLNTMAAMGWMPKNPLELLGITKGYGWTEDDFLQVPLMPQGAGAPQDMSAATGQETAVAAER